MNGHGAGATTADFAGDAGRAAASGLALVQGLADSDTTPAGGVWFVTRGAQVLEKERAGELAGAVLWGLGKVVAREAAHLQPRMIDLDPAAPVPAAELAGELLHPDAETHVAYRQGRRRAARLVRAGSGAERLTIPSGTGWRVDPDESGALDNLAIAGLPERSLQPNEVRVAVEATGLNFWDMSRALALIDEGPLGCETVGRVLEVGSEVSGVPVGDRVVGLAFGAFASEAVMREELVAPAPAGIPVTALATIPTVFVSALLSYDLAGLAAGDRVLIHAGAGGVGLAAIQLAQAAGAEVFATASAPKQDYLRSLGVRHVFDSRSTSFGEEILEATGGEGVHVVLNSLTGEGFIDASLSCLAHGGRFVELARAGILSPRRDGSGPARRGVLDPRPERAEGATARGAGRRPAARDGDAGRRRRLAADPQQVVTGRGRGRHQVHAGGPAHRQDRVHDLAARDRAPARGPHLPRHRRTRGHRLRPRRLAGGAGRRCDRAERPARPRPGGRRGDRGAPGRRRDRRRRAGRRDRRRRHRRHAGADRCHPAAARGRHPQRRRAVGRRAHEPDLGDVLRGAVAEAARSLAPASGGTADRDLDLFVLFSSVAGVLGNAGQANHAAANAFLDQLAAHRRSLGLPGQAIAWGAWSGLGEAEEHRERIARQLEAAGTGWITPRQGLRALEEVMRQDPAGGMVAAVDWEVLGENHDQHPPLLEDLLAAAGDGVDASEESPGDLLAGISDVAPAEREQRLVSFLQGELQAVMRLPSAPAPAVEFSDLGVDSLMAVELRNRLNRALAGMYVAPNTVVFDHPSVAGLAGHLAGELGGRRASRAGAGGPRVAGPRAARSGADRRGRHRHRRHGLPVPGGR